MQDMQDVEVNMKDYLDIMSDVNEVDTKSQKISDSDVELDEEMSRPQMSTAKGRADGFLTSSIRGKGLTANIQVKKDANSPWMLAANSTMDGVVTTSSSGNVLSANINVNTKKVADTENEKVKKPRYTQKMEGSIIEVSDSESMLSNDDDVLVVATKVTPHNLLCFHH